MIKDICLWLREQGSAASRLARETTDANFRRQCEGDTFRYRQAAAEIERLRAIVQEMLAARRGEDSVLAVGPDTLRRAEAAVRSTEGLA